MIDSSKKLLLFPVEIISREMDYRLALAARCLRPDNQILIGNHTDICNLALKIRHGLYVGKNLINVSPDRRHVCYDDVKAMGHRVIYHDEEGAFFQGDEAFWKDRLMGRIQPDWLRDEDTLSTWGAFQAGVYKSAAARFRGPIVVTGHPRFQLGRAPWNSLYSEECKVLTARYGNYFLLNTNFKYCNHGINPGFYLDRHRNDKVRSTSAKFFNGMFSHQKVIQEHFCDLVAKLRAAFPDVSVVIRPHPSEDSRIYQNLASSLDHVFCVRDGSLMAHLLSTRALIHNGCTTAVEGLIAGCPVVTFTPRTDVNLDFTLPNEVGIRCATVAEVLSALRGSGAASKNASERLKNSLADADPAFDSFEALERCIDERSLDLPLPVVEGNLSDLAWRRKREQTKAAFRSVLPKFLHWKHKQNPYTRTKFPGFEEKPLQARVALVEKISNTPIHMDYIHSRLVRLTRRNA